VSYHIADSDAKTGTPKVMARGLNPPHLLLASSNPMKMIQNLNHLLEQQELAKLTAELDRNAAQLFALGESHYRFAIGITDAQHWRQKISRLYYGAYNVRRAVYLKHNGSYSTDSSDHKDIDQMPDITNRESHISNLRNLREDRNLADYNHLATVADLVIAPDDAGSFATQFIADCRQFLMDKGLIV
jgi:hypothetical protein